jgi:hypothetical protein
MKKSVPLLLFLILTITSYGQKSRIYFPSETDLIFKNEITEITSWRTHRKTNQKYRDAVASLSYVNKTFTLTSYFSIHDKPEVRVQTERWLDNGNQYIYIDEVTDSAGNYSVILRINEYYENGNLIKSVSESWPGDYYHFTQVINPVHPGFQNNMLIKIHLPADTFQYIVNKQDADLHEYYLKEKLNETWIITEQSFTGYKNGEFYSYENYRNGKLMNKYTVDGDLYRAADTVHEPDFHDFTLPIHEHPTPCDTTYSADLSFKNKKRITNKRSSPEQYMRVRLYMDEEKSIMIEEYIYDYRGLLIKQNVSYDDFTYEYNYK